MLAQSSRTVNPAPARHWVYACPSVWLLPLLWLPVLLPGLAGAQEVPAPPAIDPDGVVNAASHMPPTLAGGAIARGARISIQGVRMGPSTEIRGSESQPTTEVGGVTLHIQQGDASRNAGLFLVSAGRIEAWLPEDSPLGPVRLTVTYQGHTSDPYELNLVASAIGLYPDTVDASPQTLARVRASGVGSSPLEVFIGGRAANAVRRVKLDCCQGVEELEFQLPADTPLGCAVPVLAKAGDIVSNAIGMAVHPPGEPCRDQVDWLRESVEHAEHAGFAILAHVSLDVRFVQQSNADYQFDYAFASFGRQETGKRLFPPFPPLHTCMQYTDRMNLRQVMGEARSPAGWTSIPKPIPGNRRLDAGTSLSVAGSSGTKQLNRDPRQRDYYSALIGGLPPFSHATPLPLFLRPGAYAISGQGGADVGAFSVPLKVTRPLTWTNRKRIGEVSRRQGVTVEWRASSKQNAILIVAASADHASGDSAMCVCLAPAADGRFTIPPLALSNLPITRGDRELQASYLLLMEIPAEPPARIQASGLNAAFATFISADGRVVRYQ